LCFFLHSGSASEMTYIVSGGALNSTHSLTSLCSGHYRFLCHIYVALCYMCRPTASADEYKSILVYIAHYRTVPLMRSVFMSDIKTKRKTNQHLICFESKCPHVLFTIFGNFTNSRPVQKLRKYLRLSWLPPDEENSVWNLVSVLSATMMPLFGVKLVSNPRFFLITNSHHFSHDSFVLLFSR